MEEVVINRVDHHSEHGWFVAGGGMAVFVPPSSTVIPKVGMRMIVYSDGPGTRVRGIVLDGTTVFYLTREEVSVCANRSKLN